MSKTLKKQSVKPKVNVLTDVMSFPSEEKLMKEEIKKRLVLSSPESGSVPNSVPPISFHRINISIRNQDNTEGDLIIQLDRSFSFGIGESKDANTNNLNGYSMSISMHNREGATERQLRCVTFISQLASVIKETLLTEEYKHQMDNYELEAADLKKLDPLYYKKEKGKIVDGSSPTFYPKLIWVKQSKDKPSRMFTQFYRENEYDENGDLLTADPFDFLGVKCYVTSTIKFESVFMGAKSKNIQCKVYEACLKEAGGGPKRMLMLDSVSNNYNPIVINGKNPLIENNDKYENKFLPNTEYPSEDAELQATDDEDNKPKKVKANRKKVAPKVK